MDKVANVFHPSIPKKMHNDTTQLKNILKVENVKYSDLLQYFIENSWAAITAWILLVSKKTQIVLRKLYFLKNGKKSNTRLHSILLN